MAATHDASVLPPGWWTPSRSSASDRTLRQLHRTHPQPRIVHQRSNQRTRLPRATCCTRFNMVSHSSNIDHSWARDGGGGDLILNPSIPPSMRHGRLGLSSMANVEGALDMEL